MLARLVGILHVLWLVYEVYLVRLNLKYNASHIAISTFYLKIYLPSNFIQKSWDLIWDLPITEEGVPPHFRRVRGGGDPVGKRAVNFVRLSGPAGAERGAEYANARLAQGELNDDASTRRQLYVPYNRPTDRRQFFPTDRRRPFPRLLGGIVMYSTIYCAVHNDAA